MGDVAREHDATSLMVIQAALAVVLFKLSANSEVAVKFSIAGPSPLLSVVGSAGTNAWHTERRAQRA